MADKETQTADKEAAQVEERKPDKYSQMVIDARDKYIEGWLTPAFADGYVQFHLTAGFTVEVFNNLEVPAGTYLIREGDNVNTDPLYRIEYSRGILDLLEKAQPVPADEAAKIQEAADAATEIQGTLFEEEAPSEDAAVAKDNLIGQEFHLQLVPVANETHYLTPNEFLVWLAFYAQESAEDAKEFIEHFYPPVKEELPEQPTERPRKIMQPTSKLAQKITDLDFNELVEINVTGRKDKGSVKTLAKFEYLGDDPSIELTKTMTPFERAVHFAVGTLWASGIHTFAPSKIHEVMTGKTDPTSRQAKRIEDALDKQRKTFATIDFTEEARNRELSFEGDRVEDFKIETVALDADKLAMRVSGGKRVAGYQMKDAPVLYRYSSTIKQVEQLPAKMLETGDAGSDTETNIAIKVYLVQRIAMMKGPSSKSVSNVIKYQSVYDAVGLKKPDRKKRQAVNDYILKVLNIWKSRGYIKGYRERRNGQKREAVEVSL